MLFLAMVRQRWPSLSGGLFYLKKLYTETSVKIKMLIIMKLWPIVVGKTVMNQILEQKEGYRCVAIFMLERWRIFFHLIKDKLYENLAIIISNRMVESQSDSCNFVSWWLHSRKEE